MPKKKQIDFLTLLITIFVSGITAALGIGGIALYFKGKAAVAAGNAQYIFSRSIAAAFLKPFLIPVIVLIALLILAAVKKAGGGKAKPYLNADTTAAMKRKERVCSHRGLKKKEYLITYAVIAVLIAAGAWNGGIRDVLIKAINICTECIGLG